MSVSRETKFDRYIALLLRWGAKLNLTSARNRSDAALRDLISSCLTIVPHLPQNLDRLVDLGSGQGLPAIPLAIELDIRVELVEADRRKAAFLTTALAELDLKGTVHATRIEATSLTPARCVTARALASVADLVDLALPLLAPDGCGLFLKGPAAAAEVASLPNNRFLRVELLPTGQPPTTLVKVSRLG